jgi:3',5'-cyclic AMP phosphodiesterase CpdA
VLVPEVIILDNLSPDERVAALRKFESEATPERKAEVLSVPGASGSTFAVGQGPVASQSRPPKGWEPRIAFGPDGRPDSIFSPALSLPEGEEGEHAALQTTLDLLNGMVPEGYRARLAEVRLDEAGWQRKFDPESGTGTGEAYSAPIRRYKWVVEPLPEDAELVAGMSEVDFQAAIKRVGKRKFPVARAIVDPEAVDLFVPVGDLQAGQHDGDSVEGLIGRMSLYPIIVKAEIKRLAKTGIKVKRIVSPSLGDLVENTIGFYANQTWVVTLHMRDQRKLARRLIQVMLEELATLGLPILVPVVPGNHGENRNSKGKAYTDPSDNSDIEIMETVAEILRANPTLADQVEFHFPEGMKQNLVLDLGFGYGVGFHHGHLSGHGSGHAAAKQQSYLRQMALANQPIGHAKYIISGHFHSAMMVTMPGDKTWIQIPAMCDTSEFFEEAFGLNGGPGLITFTMGPNGLGNYQVHKAPTKSALSEHLAQAEEVLARAA